VFGWRVQAACSGGEVVVRVSVFAAPRMLRMLLAGLTRRCPGIRDRRRGGSMLRTLERSSLVIVVLLLIALGVWIGSSESRLDRAVRQQEERIDRTTEQVDLHERAIVEHTVSIESNRASIERNSGELEIQGERLERLLREASRREEAIEDLRRRAEGLETRLTDGEARSREDSAAREAQGRELAELRDQLRQLELLRVGDARDLDELRGRLRAIEEERTSDAARLRRIEEALGIDPGP
jgi:predicted RNase H-like nuclease (RuvC/YqgF family)